MESASEEVIQMEFSIGDYVTFKPYELSHERVVCNYTYLIGTELLYVLRPLGDSGSKGINITSGRCITESKYYEPWEQSEHYPGTTRASSKTSKNT